VQICGCEDSRGVCVMMTAQPPLPPPLGHNGRGKTQPLIHQWISRPLPRDYFTEILAAAGHLETSLALSSLAYHLVLTNHLTACLTCKRPPIFEKQEGRCISRANIHNSPRRRRLVSGDSIPSRPPVFVNHLLFHFNYLTCVS
jgi:hypothetical protein